MIYIPEEEIYLKNPRDFKDLTVKLRNYLSGNLRRGLCIVKIPDWIQDKQEKKIYKVGFLNELLGLVYPNHTKKMNYDVISEEYHMWFTYRQFANLIKPYEQSRLDYIGRK